jgi:hypothetical protein
LEQQEDGYQWWPTEGKGRTSKVAEGKKEKRSASLGSGNGDGARQGGAGRR